MDRRENVRTEIKEVEKIVEKEKIKEIKYVP